MHPSFFLLLFIQLNTLTCLIESELIEPNDEEELEEAIKKHEQLLIFLGMLSNEINMAWHSSTVAYI